VFEVLPRPDLRADLASLLIERVVRRALLQPGEEGPRLDTGHHLPQVPDGVVDRRPGADFDQYLRDTGEYDRYYSL